MMSSVPPKSDCSRSAYRALLAAIAILGILSLARGGSGEGVVLLAAFLILLVATEVQRSSVAFGWLVASLLCGAIAGRLIAPPITDGPTQWLWSAQCTFWGAVAGTAIGTLVGLSASRLQFRIHHLMELTLACALLMSLWTFYCAAEKRVERRDRRVEEQLRLMMEDGQHESVR